MSIHQDRIIKSTLSSVSVGDTVVTADDAEIGKVGEIAQDAIKLNEPMHADSWIAGDYVLSAEGGRVRLSFVRADLGGHRMDAPQPDPAETLAVQGGDRVIDEREQFETRVRMERELAEQRQALPHMHKGGPEGPPDTFGTIGEPVESELQRVESRRRNWWRGGRRDGEPETVATGGIGNLSALWRGRRKGYESTDTVATRGIGNMGALWLAGFALLGVAGAAAAWGYRRRKNRGR